MPPIIGVGLVLSLVLVFVSEWYVGTRLSAQLLRRGQTIVGAVVNIMENADESREIQAFVAGMGREPDVDLIVVAAGTPLRVIACTDARWLDKPLDELPDPEHVRNDLERAIARGQASYDMEHRQGVLDVTAPVRLRLPGREAAGGPHGAVMLHLMSHVVKRDLASLSRGLATGSVALLLVLCGASVWVLQRVVIRPVAAISQTIARRAAGDDQARAEVHRRDELGALAAHLNELLDKLAARERALEEARDEALASGQRAELALAEAENLRRALDEHAIVAVTDRCGKITYANDKFCQLSKYARHELLGQDHRIVNSGYHDKAFFVELWRTVTRGDVWHGEICNRAKDGTRYWVATTIVPFKDGQGQVRQHVVIRTDISELRQAQQHLQRHQAVMHAIRRTLERFISETNRHKLFDEVLDDLLRLSESEYGFIGEVLHDEQGQPYLKTFALTNIAWNEATRAFFERHAPDGMEFRNLKTLFGEGLTTGEPVISNAPAQDPRSGGLPPGHPPLRAFLGVPLRVGRRLVGMFGLANCVRGYSPADLEFLAPLSEVLANLIDAARNRRLREQMQTELAASEQRFRDVAEAAAEFVWEVDAGGRYTYLSDRATLVTGYSVDQLLRQGLDANISLLDQEELKAWFQSLRERPEPFRGAEFRIQRPDGELRWVELSGKPILDAAGVLVGFRGMGEDVTQRKNLEHELRRAARTDKLTGLANRALLYERLQAVLSRAESAAAGQVALLFLDFDRFKLINDSLGHEVGDLLLIEIARRLEHTVAAAAALELDAGSPTTARLGGDEFVVLLESLRQPEDAEDLARRLLVILAEPYYLGTHRVYCSASIGIASRGDPGDRAEDLIRNADTAMYEAKQAGKGCYAVFDATMLERIHERLEIEIDLRRAVSSPEFVLHYQPVVSLESGGVEGYEALVRWQHPRRGLLAAHDFLPAAEESGLIVPLGDWTLREACRQLVSWWQEHGRGCPPYVSVNLSQKELCVPDLPGRLLAILEETGADPTGIHLEVTESAVMRDVALSIRVLNQLKQLGFKIELDDFGTGHSSLASLHQFPVDSLKVDKSFVVNLEHRKDFAAVVNAIATLAVNLGIDVVAEGVETPTQVFVLQTLACRLAQGSLFGDPMPADEAIRHRPRTLVDGVAGSVVAAHRVVNALTTIGPSGPALGMESTSP